MGYILDCMVIAVQASVGIFFWGILSCLFGFIIILYQMQKQKQNPKIYRGQKIIINGGKEDD